jgi:hypothetical protein
MPILELDAETAWRNIYAGLSRDRLQPVAQPHFTTSFKLTPGAKVFTIGSCFARNIEVHLAKHGFDIPALRIFGDAHHVVNKYNPYSILQEIKWALKLARRPTREERLVPLGNGRYIDLYLHCNAPEAYCLDYIDRAEMLFSEIPESPYFVMTLGLIEVWYDNMTGAYLNEPQNFLKYYADDREMREHFSQRFVFRIMSFDETLKITHEVFSLLKKASPQCKVILTVSPVPLGGSFSGNDVKVANMYSKSVLRVVAEEIHASFDFVDYFPSYESVMLSERALAWQADNQHVTDEVVAVNVQRMVEAYVT